MKKTVIIGFEGIDGSGKGVQSEILVENLRDKGLKVLVADFPQYKGFFGKKVGELLSGDNEVDAQNLDVESTALWYALDRFEFFKKVDLTNFDVLVMNRSTYSNIGFQTTRVDKDKQLEFIEWLKELEFNKLDIPKAHRTIFLDINENISKENVAKKGHRDYVGDKADVYEDSKDMMTNVQDVYRQLEKTEENFIKINCMKNDDEMYSIFDVSNMIFREIKELLK